MEITVQKSNQLKSLAIMMMICLHLFNRPYHGLFQPLVFIGIYPLSYYISLFCDACVPIFCFVSGYGLYYTYLKNPLGYGAANKRRIFKLYVTYWIILILFTVLLASFLQKEGYPGSLLKFLLNFFGLSSSYNGAWWFLFIYVTLVASSSMLFLLLRKIGSFFLLVFSLLCYFVAFYFRVYRSELFDTNFLNWLQTELCLYGTSLLPFVFGIVSLKEQWNSKITFYFLKIKYKNSFALLGIIMLIVFHGLIPNFIIAPFLALPFIFLFVQLQLPVFLNQTLNYLSIHATNIWLIHMFFYVTFFNTFIYSPTYVILIYSLLVLCSLISSMLVNNITPYVFSKLKLS